MEEQIRREAAAAVQELIDTARLKSGQILVVGCSSSEIIGERIGSHSSVDAAGAVAAAILPIVKEHGIYLAAQCCEHLNRALIVEQACADAYGLECVNDGQHIPPPGRICAAAFG